MNKLTSVYDQITDGFLFGVVDEHQVGTDDRNGMKVERFTVKSGERIVSVSCLEGNMWVRIERVDGHASDARPLYRLNNIPRADESILDGIRTAMIK